LWVEGTHYKQYFQSEEKETMAWPVGDLQFDFGNSTLSVFCPIYYTCHLIYISSLSFFFLESFPQSLTFIPPLIISVYIFKLSMLIYYLS
jgi:hypothetical protein